jgi:transposase-like protein
MGKSYVPMPRMSGVRLERFRIVMDVVSGEITVSEAARKLGLSRNHFQALMHRGLEALGEGVSPHPAGRPPTPTRERALQEENSRLQQEIEHLRKRVETADQVLVLLRGYLQGRRKRERTSKGRRPAEDE